LKAIVVWGERIDDGLAEQCLVPVFSWERFLELGKELESHEIDRRWVSIRPGNCASLIYTSGTTGPPKAVMISHDNLTWTARNIIDNYMDLNFEDRVVSFLPLSHIAAQLIDIHCTMSLGASLWFAQPDALKGTLTKTLREVRPTFFFGVPRVWEKIQEKMDESIKQSSLPRQWLLAIGRYFGHEKSIGRQYPGSPSTATNPWGFNCVHMLVLNHIKEALGLDQAKGCFTAAAPISPETLWYFASLDIPVYEVFGQSESTGPHTVSGPNCWKIGYCGRPIKGSISKVDQETHELLYKGRHIFMGYMYNAAESEKSFDEQGFFKSGDLAEFDDNNDPDITPPSGFMRIIGRSKDLIVTAGGENIAPIIIEQNMKAELPQVVSNCMVIGDKKKYLTMLVALKTKIDHGNGLPEDELADEVVEVSQSIGSSATLYSEVKNDEKWRQYIDQGIMRLNKKASSNAQKIQKWSWLHQDFSEKGGEMTPTMKVKRGQVIQEHQDVIDDLYKA
jgi:long-chain-fatty-acid--CoA ligase ACSBG